MENLRDLIINFNSYPDFDEKKGIENFKNHLEKLIKDPKNFDINGQLNNNFTLLHYAAQKNNIEIANLLIEKYANIDSKDSTGRTPLIIAASNGHIQMVNLLLLNKASPNAKDNFGSTALKQAIAKGNLEIAKSLIRHSGGVLSDKTIEIAIDFSGLQVDNLIAKEIYNYVTLYIPNFPEKLFEQSLKNTNLGPEFFGFFQKLNRKKMAEELLKNNAILNQLVEYFIDSYETVYKNTNNLAKDNIIELISIYINKLNYHTNPNIEKIFEITDHHTLAKIGKNLLDNVPSKNDDLNNLLIQIYNKLDGATKSIFQHTLLEKGYKTPSEIRTHAVERRLTRSSMQLPEPAQIYTDKFKNVKEVKKLDLKEEEKEETQIEKKRERKNSVWF